MAFIRVLTFEEASGALRERWERSLQSSGRISNIGSVSSLRPALIETFFAHYSTVMNSPDSGLTPAERQMVAAVTSAANRCQYWTLAHAEYLRRETNDDGLASQFRLDWHLAKLTEKQRAMLDYAELLTLNPGSIAQIDVDNLRSVGWRDEDVIDIAHIVGLFNYLVRLADGLGISIDPDWSAQADELWFKSEVTPKPVGFDIDASDRVLRQDSL